MHSTLQHSIQESTKHANLVLALQMLATHAALAMHDTLSLSGQTPNTYVIFPFPLHVRPLAPLSPSYFQTPVTQDALSLPLETPAKPLKFPCRWITPELKRLMFQRDKLKKIASRFPKDDNWTSYKHMKNNVNYKVRNAKMNYNETCIKRTPSIKWTVAEVPKFISLIFFK